MSRPCCTCLGAGHRPGADRRRGDERGQPHKAPRPAVREPQPLASRPVHTPSPHRPVPSSAPAGNPPGPSGPARPAAAGPPGRPRRWTSPAGYGGGVPKIWSHSGAENREMPGRTGGIAGVGQPPPAPARPRPALKIPPPDPIFGATWFLCLSSDEALLSL
jgi:hypothetical protein